MFIPLLVLALLLISVGLFIVGLSWLAVVGGVVLLGTLGWRGMRMLEQRHRDEP